MGRDRIARKLECVLGQPTAVSDLIIEQSYPTNINSAYLHNGGTMFNRILSLVLTVLLMNVGFTPAFASPPQGEESARLAKVKADIARRGVGEKAGVKVKLRNKTEVKGYVYQVGDDSFVVADRKTDARTTIAYQDVEQVKRKGIPTAAKIGIGIGVGFFLTGMVLAI